MMYLGDQAVGIASNLPLPSFMNHLESGSFQLDSANAYGEYNIQLQNISKPKGILVYAEGFSMFDAKADKPMLGAFASLYIAPADIDNANVENGWTMIHGLINYAVNWGSGTNSGYPTYRRSTNEANRGIYLYNETLKQVRLRGFLPAQSDYDFKFNHTYHWLVWD